MKERPILMCGEMVRAALNGTKTQTRRVVNPKLWPLVEASAKHNGHVALDMVDFELVSPYGSKKDRLWVRETFTTYRTKTKVERRKTEAVLKSFFDGKATDIAKEALKIPLATGALKALYAADFGEWAYDVDSDLGPWKPSIFMPRWASRITLEITGVRVERLQGISMEDAIAEGVCMAEPESTFHFNGRIIKSGPHYKFYGKELERLKQQTSNPVWSYETLWDAINGKKFPWKSNPWVWVVEFKVVEPKEGK